MGVLLVITSYSIHYTKLYEKKIENGYRLLTNNGSLAGQEVFHLHFHLVGGRALGSMG